jgi:hypothetical protein
MGAHPRNATSHPTRDEVAGSVKVNEHRKRNLGFGTYFRACGLPGLAKLGCHHSELLARLNAIEIDGLSAGRHSVGGFDRPEWLTLLPAK